MNSDEARKFLTRVFAALTDPAVGVADVARFFAPGYEQVADGNHLDRKAFVDHLAVLKEACASGRVSFERVVAEGNTAATVHVVDLTKKNGERTRLKLIAFFEFEDGLIRRVEEMSRLEEGDAADRDLGSRTSE